MTFHADDQLQPETTTAEKIGEDVAKIVETSLMAKIDSKLENVMSNQRPQRRPGLREDMKPSDVLIAIKQATFLRIVPNQSNHPNRVGIENQDHQVCHINNHNRNIHRTSNTSNNSTSQRSHQDKSFNHHRILSVSPEYQVETKARYHTMNSYQPDYYSQLISSAMCLYYVTLTTVVMVMTMPWTRCIRYSRDKTESSGSFSVCSSPAILCVTVSILWT